MARYKRMLVSTKLFNIAVNDSGAKKCTSWLCCNWVIVLTEFVIRGSSAQEGALNLCAKVAPLLSFWTLFTTIYPFGKSIKLVIINFYPFRVMTILWLSSVLLHKLQMP